MQTTPYTYLIGWSQHSKYYYGVRYAKNCTPSDLWVTYFTSSKLVQDMRLKHGEPDIIQVRRTFEDRDSAVFWEQKVLSKLDVINNPLWLNQNIAGAINIVKQSNEHIQRRFANRVKSQKQIDAAKNNIKKASASNIGRKQSIDAQEKKRKTYAANWDKNKISAQRDPWCRYLIDGKVFLGNKSVIEEFGITEPTIYNRIKNPKYNWKRLDGI